jgi:type IV pilus assembly protein PilM
MIGNNKILGVEIGRDEFKAAEVRIINGRLSVGSYTSLELPRTVMADGNILNGDAFTEAFARLCRDGNFTAKKVIFGIDNQNTILRFASFPKVPEKKQRGLVQLNAQEYLPLPISEVEIDFVTLSESQNDEGMQINVLLCAARKSLIQRIMTASSEAGLEILSIIPSPVSYANAILRRVSYRDFMAVRVGRKGIFHIFFKDGAIAFIRNVSIDSAFSKMLASSVPDEDRPIDDNSQLISEIVNGISSSGDYYRNRIGGVLEKICITGVSAFRDSTAQLISDELQIDTECFRLFEPDVKSGSSPPDDFESCISLALSMPK